MSLLSYNALRKLAARGVIRGIPHEFINSASIDISLGPVVMVERQHPTDSVISLKKRTPLFMGPHDLRENGPITMAPGEFILAQSDQIFHLPTDISAEYKLKSSMARIGLEHLNAGWCDAGWNGSVLTLELKNMTRYHSITLEYGDRIGQMVFYKHDAVPEDRSYAARGRYNGDQTVSGVKK